MVPLKTRGRVAQNDGAMSDDPGEGGGAADRAGLLAAVVVALAVLVGWIAAAQSARASLFYENLSKGRTPEVVSSESVSSQVRGDAGARSSASNRVQESNR